MSLCTGVKDLEGTRQGTYFSIGSGEALEGMKLCGAHVELGDAGSSSSLSGVGIKEQGFSHTELPSQGCKRKNTFLNV